MSGSTIGSLSVQYFSERFGNESVDLWRRSGDNGDQWRKAIVPFRLVQPVSNVSLVSIIHG